ncbi:helix-turn-helix domain-containing protein [Oricola indica]|uniref:helix-turn-helix domain-containing protein n=1 Tax=Oricola indica TaxID=2872591 RepID=UPI003CCBCDC4
MPRTLGRPRHEALRDFIVEQREQAGLTQHQVSALLDRPQSFIASIETGRRRIDVVELLDLAEAIGFDPHDAVRRLLGAAAD